MQASMSLGGFIADPSDDVGPLFDWYRNGDVEFTGADPVQVIQREPGQRRVSARRLGQHRPLDDRPASVRSDERLGRETPVAEAESLVTHKAPVCLHGRHAAVFRWPGTKRGCRITPGR